MSGAKPIIFGLNVGFRFPAQPTLRTGGFEAAYDQTEDMDYELVEVAGDNEWRDYHTIRREAL